MAESMLLVRRARPEEAKALSELIMRSKAHWGYDQDFLDIFRSDLSIEPEDIERNPVYCAEVNGTLAGMYQLYLLNETEAYLDHLFVEPTFIGQGVGALLWHHAVDLAVAMGARIMTLGADPNARPFYEHMGAVVTGWDESPLFPGRKTPRMRYDLPQ